MLTDIFYRSLYYKMFNCEFSDFSFVSANGTSCTGKLRNISPFFGTAGNYYPHIAKFRKDSSYGAGVVFGTGTTPPTISDRTWAGTNITTFTASVSVSSGEENGKAYIEALYTITNTGSEAFTIGEICTFANCSASTNTNYSALMDRTVLENPVAIPVGGIGQVTYRIYADMMTS